MAQRTITGTLTIPNSELKVNGTYTDLSLNLVFTTNGVETVSQSISLNTTNKYSFTYDDAGVDIVKVQLKRISNGVLLGETKARGVLPRSFLTNTVDLFYSENKHNSFTYDAGLAILACSGGQYAALAKEIVEGILKAASTSNGVPFKANHVYPQGADQDLRTGTIAMVVYGLGYYLEKNTLALNKVAVANELNNILSHLLSYRNISNNSSLLIGGYNNDFSTVDNILSYFAFKQAGYVLNETYLEVANELAADIKSRLYDAATKKFYKAILEGGAFVTTDELETNILGAFFFIEEDDMVKAEELMEGVEESFSMFDATNNISAYKALINESKIWVEGTYAIAAIYFKLGDSIKYHSITRNLNKLLDTDGSFKYATIKDGLQKVLEYKSVASTAWSYISNMFPEEIFTINPGAVTVTGAAPFYLNQKLEVNIQKNDCATGTGSTVPFMVYPGQFTSTISQADADQQATNYANTNGQAYANANGTCVVPYSYFNVERTMLFESAGCPVGSIGTIVSYSIPANAFGSHISLEHANALADAKLMVDGQAYADSVGVCELEKHVVNITLNKSVVAAFDDDNVYGTIYSNEAVKTLVGVTYEYSINNGTSWTSSTANLYAGSTNSHSFFITSVPSGSGESVLVRITGVTPGEFDEQIYSYPGKVITTYTNLVRSAYFIKECGSVGINANSIVKYEVPAGSISSVISQQHANTLADVQVAENGQEWANNNGFCDGVSIYKNQRQAQTFTKQGCSTGYTAQSMEYVVEAGTYQSTVSLADANNLALADIAANGQSWVNARTSCILSNDTIVLNLVKRVDYFGTYDRVYVKATASKAVTTPINVSYNLWHNGIMVEGADVVTIQTGQTISNEVMAKQTSPNEGNNVTFEIGQITPTSHGSTLYIKG